MTNNRAAVWDAALFRITEGRHPDEARVFATGNLPDDSLADGCCEVCHEPEGGCDCPSEYMREHDSGSER